MTGQAPAGWYAPDPARPTHLRYWDGASWTTHSADPLPSHAAVPPEPSPFVAPARRQAAAPVPTVATRSAMATRPTVPARRKVAIAVAGVVAVVLAVAVARTPDSTTTPAGALSSPDPSVSSDTTDGGASTSTVSPTSSSSPTPRGTPAGSASTPTTIAGRSGTALAQVRRLVVKGRAPMTGYLRALFGPAWYDVDRNGCDTRDDILTRDLVQRTYKDACKVASGVLHDPYTGATIAFHRGVGTSTAVQIDHVVALGDAWQKGAQQWSPGKRLAFANDPLNLLAVSGPVNQRKGDGDTATWLPPNKSYRCAYVARQVAVKAKYGVSVTAAEKAAMVRVLSTCPTIKVVTSSTVVPVAGASSPRSLIPTPSSPSQPSTLPIVHAGAFCSIAGARGVTSTGRSEVCTTSPTDSRLRWRHRS
jgi:hypothetical protein